MKPSETLSGRLREFREKIKSLILEELIVYGIVIILDIAHDFTQPIYRDFFDLRIHPISFGVSQWFILITFGLLFLRKWKQRSYFK